MLVILYFVIKNEYLTKVKVIQIKTLSCTIMEQNCLNLQDQSFINLALNLSYKNIGITSGNPSVACVLVKNDVIISTGITGEGGIPHAENIAILKADKNVSGSTAYVTLEPCSHFGKTPPCVDLIIKSKISRVVIVTIDPDERVDGLGIKKLRAAGIQVVVGGATEKARKINQGFFSSKIKGRPYITLKLATSFNGKIADKNSDNQWISSLKSREYAHYLRLKNDAILVGSGTLINDDPTLNCRLSGLEKYSPSRIILSSNLDFNTEKKVFQGAKSIPTYIATNNPDNKKFTDLGVKIINFKEGNLKYFARQLPKIGINNLLVEGGSIVAGEFLKAGLIDKFIWIKSAKIIIEGTDAISGFDINKFSQNKNFKITKTRKIDEDFVTYFESEENSIL